MKKNMKIVLLVVLIVAITFTIYFFNKENEEELIEEVTISYTEFTLNDLSSKFNELYPELNSYIENGNMVIESDSVYEFVLNEYQLSIITNDENVLEVLKKVVMTYQSFYYDDLTELEKTIDMFLNNEIYLMGVEFYYEDGVYEIYIDLAEELEVYSPDYSYYDDEKIFLLTSENEFSYESNDLTLNNAYFYYDEESSNVNFGGIISLNEEKTTFEVNIYDQNEDLISTNQYELTEFDKSINLNIDLTSVNKDVSYILLTVK